MYKSSAYVVYFLQAIMSMNRKELIHRTMQYILDLTVIRQNCHDIFGIDEIRIDGRVGLPDGLKRGIGIGNLKGTRKKHICKQCDYNNDRQRQGIDADQYFCTLFCVMVQI